LNPTNEILFAEQFTQALLAQKFYFSPVTSMVVINLNSDDQLNGKKP
jgi:hypothetical protein